MTRLALFAGIALLAGSSLKGELLYWMVDESAAGQYDFAYAGVKDVTSGSYLDYATEDGVVEWPGVWQVDKGAFAGGGVYGSLGGEVAGHSFMIELYNDTGALASSETKTYAELVALKAIVESSADRERQSAWTGGAFEERGQGGTPHGAPGHIPEPTSGLMLLLGTALLALRRKRA